jgi:pimeloyl-ACP methyl ester carboxylesterase
VRLVLIHGIGVGPAYMRPLARALAAHDVVVPTLPGWIGNPIERPPLDLVELGETLEPHLPGVLVANSMGCQVAVELAIRRPELVESLVLVGPTVDPSTRPLGRFGVRLLADWAQEPSSLWPIIVRDYLAMGPRRFARTARFAWRQRIEQRLPLVAQPTLVVRGQRDTFVSQRWCEEAAALLPNGRLAVVPGAHAAQFSHPSAVAQEVEQHLREDRRLLEPR